jgi:amino acid transporter
MADQLERRLGLGGATAVNVLAMIGVGPFVTIPLLLRTMGGPQAMLGWFIGAVVAFADGLVWAELGAAMPRSGGGYQYLLEAYGSQGAGRLFSFLFLWQTVAGMPLVMASGATGFARYAGFFLPTMTVWQSKALAMIGCALATALIYRRIDRIGRWSVGLGLLTLAAGVWIVAGGVMHGSMQAISFPTDAWTISRAFWLGLGGATLYAAYDYMGYNTICGVGGEVVRPERTIPRSILIAIALVCALYFTMNLSIVSVVPWRDAVNSTFIASDFIGRVHGPRFASAMTILILIIALSSLYANLLTFSRVPFAAASEGRFFRVFARVHPTGQFPSFSVLYMGAVSAVCCLLDLDALINAVTVLYLMIAAVPMVPAVTALRRRRPDGERPFRMWLYPLPSLVALAGWIFVITTSGWKYIGGGFGVIAVGVAAYLWRARTTHEWPFDQRMWRRPLGQHQRQG